MLFRVKNLGLIDEAEIKLDGITVITGENNVGKSTIGKMLYCVNNVFLRDSVEEMKIHRIERVIINSLSYTSEGPIGIARSVIDELVLESNFVPFLVKSWKQEHSLRNFLEEHLLSRLDTPYDGSNEYFNSLENKISEILQMDNQDIISGLFKIAIGTNFSGTIHNVYGKNEVTEIELKLNKLDQGISITLTDNVIINNPDPIAFEEAIYIENPHIMRDGEKRANESNFFLTFDSRQRLVKLIPDDSQVDFWEKEEMALEIKNTLEKISLQAPGKLVKKNAFSNKLEYEEGKHRFDLINVSSGVKTFAILKNLLVNGKLKRNGMLILDEPEIHLHPEWQLVFAEILVLLQKQFNLKIVVNTHSVYFLMAIEDYSKMHEVSENCNYYLVERKGNHSSCRDCTDVLNEIYQHFADPMYKLHNEVR